MRHLFIALLVAGCSSNPIETPVDAGTTIVDAGATCGCRIWNMPSDAGRIDSELDELSGLVASRARPGVLYAHNDSGDSPRFFALEGGSIVQTFTLADATARDWEDIALGPCPSGTCVYLGDIGDNNFVRTDCAIYRVPEPSDETTSVTWERFPYAFPNDEKHNAETIFMNAQTGVLYLVTKENTGVSAVYRFPLPFDATKTAQLEFVTQLTIPASGDSRLTGGDVNVCGDGVLLRMYNRLVEYRLPEGAATFEDIFQVNPVSVPVADEQQGEAVAYGADGRSYFSASEQVSEAPVLSEYFCR
ncbi:MAG: hypothetical protein ACO1OB_19685 [Archangium sp.]